ncbi:SDR family oxidoreductase [Paenibacillus thalictri]|uniref:SDR family oxidoreductase n=1 Tax=Paenibacillus thalictri TaxID=2527873 RepID=A0A4Q9DGK4_9BACL|nr:SDR family oxidoreductase [Paenibacillus thalictri]TBL70338.1 SDR family oxidoreductase [Paenibacillus thalictri]
MEPKLLIIGVTGNVGKEVASLLSKRAVPFKAAVRKLSSAAPQPYRTDVYLDITKPESFALALQGVERIFLIRPPAISDPRYFEPFLQEASLAKVKHIVFLSLLGAQTLFFVPHRKIEKRILKTNMKYTFLRPSFFMQNLNTTHLEEIRDDHRIFVPAGQGRTSFIDVRDIAEVAVRVLTEEGHENRAYDLTGSEALTYGEVAARMTEAWGIPITYANPSIADFKAYWKKKGFPADMINVMTGIYFTAKIGAAKKVTRDLERLIGRPPITIGQYVKDYRSIFGWM